MAHFRRIVEVLYFEELHYPYRWSSSFCDLGLIVAIHSNCSQNASSFKFKFSLFTIIQKKCVNTIIIETKKEGNKSYYTCYNKYYIGKVCSSQRSKAFGFAGYYHGAVIIIRGGFICKTSYRPRKIYLSVLLQGESKQRYITPLSS